MCKDLQISSQEIIIPSHQETFFPPFLEAIWLLHFLLIHLYTLYIIFHYLFGLRKNRSYYVMKSMMTASKSFDRQCS